MSMYRIFALLLASALISGSAQAETGEELYRQQTEEAETREQLKKEGMKVDVDTFYTTQGPFYINRPVGFLLSDAPDVIVTSDSTFIMDEYFTWTPISVKETEYGTVHFVTNKNVMEWMHGDSVKVVLELPTSHTALPELQPHSGIYPVRRYNKATDSHVFGGVVVFHRQSSKWVYTEYTHGLVPYRVEAFDLVVYERNAGVVLRHTGDDTEVYTTFVFDTKQLLEGKQGVPRF